MRYDSYGVRHDGPTIGEFAGLSPGAGADELDLADSELVRVARIRYLSDAGFPVWDFSYAWGLTLTNEACWVRLPYDDRMTVDLGQIPKGFKSRNGYRGVKAAWIQVAQDLGLSPGAIARLGLFDKDCTVFSTMQ